MKAELIVPAVMLFVPLRAQWITLERRGFRGHRTGIRIFRRLCLEPLRITERFHAADWTPDFQMTLEGPKTDSVPADVTTFPTSSILGVSPPVMPEPRLRAPRA